MGALIPAPMWLALGSLAAELVLSVSILRLWCAGCGGVPALLLWVVCLAACVVAGGVLGAGSVLWLAFCWAAPVGVWTGLLLAALGVAVL